jgi:hypothetical protein
MSEPTETMEQSLNQLVKRSDAPVVAPYSTSSLQMLKQEESHAK